MGRFDGRVVYLTGGGSGLGAALVARFVAEGAKVSVLDRFAEKNRALAARFGAAIVTTDGDVRDLGAHESAVQAALAAFGRLDVYIANAAIWDGNVTLLHLPPDRIDAAFDEVFAVNVKGALLGAKASAPALVAQRGAMVFTLSIAALRAGGGGPLYTASKTAGIGLVRELAYELAPYVRVNGVCPGAMATDLRGPQSLGFADTALMATIEPDVVRSAYPLDFFPTPEDYVGPYLYLASSDAAVTSGTLIEADLGMAARGIRAVAGRAAGLAQVPYDEAERG
jgi:2,3-dihydroxy-2,3-dihydrophenylpropionate dehydrogenase